MADLASIDGEVHNVGHGAVGSPAVRRACVVVLLAGAFLAGAVSVAYADGDPASDYLITSQVFLTSQSTSVSPAQRQLLALVESANRKGFAIRVAVISTDYDLGSITALWRKPQIYARFLGLELSSAYRGRLLVVMPNGFGFNWPGHGSAPTYRLLAGLPAGVGGDALAIAGQTAVRRLAASAGITLRVRASRPSARASAASSDAVTIVAVAAAGLLVLAALAFLVARGWRRRPRVPKRERPAVSGHGLRIGVRWAIPGFALMCTAAVVVPIVALHRSGALHGSEAPSVSAASSVVTPPPFSWPAGRRPAPEFALRDQQGHPVSISAYRGRPVIVTFIDPLCRNLCPLEAQVLNDVERQLPAARRPAILAVSVDVYANARADLLQDVREWRLVPQWRWAVGSPALLTAVWNRYGIGVKVTTKKIAGSTINYITHTEAAYIVDQTGHERALFFWPFYPRDVERVLHQLN